MTSQPQGTFESDTFICLLFILIVSFTLPARNVRAEDCLAAPNSPAGEGTGWYYRLDRATQKKCWHMRALDTPIQQGTASAREALPTPALAIPIPRPRPSAAGSALASSRGATGSISSKPKYEIPLPRARPPAAGPALSSKRLDPGPIASPKEVKASPGIDGSIVETRSPSSKEAPLPQANGSLHAAAPDIAPSTSAVIDEASPSTIEKQQIAPSSPSDAAPGAPSVNTPSAITTAKTKLLQSDTTVLTESSSSDAGTGVAVPPPNAAHPMDATIEDGGSATAKDFVPQRSTSSSFGSNDAESTPDVSLTERGGPPAVAAPVSRFSWPILGAGDHETIDRNGTPFYSALMWVKPLYLIVAFVMAMVVMAHYVIFRTFRLSRAQISDTWPDDIGIDSRYKDPEFYRKLRQAATIGKF
jgi:hypothetical protein